ncbi:glutamate ABC transporter substrate-binding protein [Actinophytocola sediminis]
MTHRPVRRLLVAVAVVATVAGCGGGDPVGRSEVSAAAPRPAGASELTEPPAAQEQVDCGDPTAQSPRPPAELPTPGQMPGGTTMARIQADGKLDVGVDQNTFNFGYREPDTGEIVGFDIDMARAIAQAIFGDPDAVRLRAITSAQRIPVLQEGEVDIVIRTMSITCERLEEVAFSSVYYEAGQRVLVKKESGYTGIESLGGKKVCATEGSTSLRNIAAAASKPVPVQVQNWTDCLVLLQQNQVDAVSTDDTILAGLAAQDPSTHVVGDPIYTEPYGMAMPKGQNDFVRFVNGVIEQTRTDGRWARSYATWMAPLLGASAGPPAARYPS